LILKEELSQAHAVNAGTDKNKTQLGHHHESSSVNKTQAMEQTILKLQSIVKKLSAENKYLRSSTKGSQVSLNSSIPSTPSYMSQSDRKKEEVFEKMKNEHDKLLKLHKDALEKISALEIDLELSQKATISASCPHCNRKSYDEMATQDIDSLKQQLEMKDALLNKAKILLNRAASKEKQLKELVMQLKKRCCELEGVPVISEENSESGL
jgi:hypothetical protein